MSYEGIYLYPFDQLPDVGIPTCDQTSETEYFQYASAIQLSEEDQAILQATFGYRPTTGRLSMNILILMKEIYPL